MAPALPFPASLDLAKASSCFASSALRSKNVVALTLCFLLLEDWEFDMVVGGTTFEAFGWRIWRLGWREALGCFDRVATMAALDRVSCWNLQNTSHVSSQNLTTT